MRTLREFYRSKRILLTGHTGFKGAWLTLWLERLGANVIGLSLPPVTEPNLFELARVEDACRHNIGDIRDSEQVQAFFDKYKPDGVFHLAAQPIVRLSYREPKYTFDVNAGGVVNVLEAIRRSPSVTFAVFITTDKVYENQPSRIAYKESDPLGGSDPYSAGKSAAELMIASYRRSFFGEGGLVGRLGIASARSGNVIGGGDWAEDRILPDAVRSARADTPLEIRNPQFVRPWQHVLDPLAGYLTLGVKLKDNPRAYEGAWNFGPAEDGEITVKQLVTSFHEYLGRGGRCNVADDRESAMRETDVLKLCCDKSREKLEWRPTYGIAEAVERTADWYRRVMWDESDARRQCVAEIDRFAQKAKQNGQWWAI